MGDSQEKGNFQADIPADAVAEALRSVERAARGAPAEGEPAGARQAEAEGTTVEVEVGAGDVTAEVTSLRAQLELSQALGRETQKKLEDQHDRLLRAVADLENHKKRVQREKEELQKFGAEKVLRDFLPVVDNLDRALAAAPAGDPLVDGVKLCLAAFEQALARHGVKAYSALGLHFDPARHEALLQVPSAEVAPGTVVLEHARGFLLHDRLLRPAMVGVAVAPPAAPPAGEAGAGSVDGSGQGPG